MSSRFIIFLNLLWLCCGVMIIVYRCPSKMHVDSVSFTIERIWVSLDLRPLYMVSEDLVYH